MTNIITNIVLTMMYFCSSLFLGSNSLETTQESKSKIEISSISVVTSSVKELKTIDWNDVQSVFIENPKNKKIALNFELKSGKLNTFKNSFSVNGKTEDLHKLILKAQKGVNGLIKISNKNQKA
ncbi:MAG: hypothetical protein CMB99_02540 [Flavobacteriaceae bacterium]|nr:hypothetical protein [Flavobacteriaceae bacterium]|tara:strand:- start:75637 stop:76008 length:372 start_codon:yes stop_codon:yes gene_type:complete